jgi:hypothetical protein
MSNREVAGLNALAQKHGGQLSVNPDTGLPEAGFLDSILPVVAGAGLTYFSGGAINPLMAAGIVGGISALDSKDLSKGLVAGLGAYGGGSMVGGLAGLGAEAAYMPGAAGEAARQAATQEAIANGTYQSQVGTGLNNFIDQPMNSLSTLGGGSVLKGSLPILASLAPAAADYIDNAGDEEEGDGAPAQKKGYIRKYAFDPVTGQYKQVGAYEAGGDPNRDVSSEAGTAGAFGGVGQSEYEKAQGMAAGGVTDSSRIYDYLMGRGPNPMQFRNASPQVSYNMPKSPEPIETKLPEPITPTTPILDQQYDKFGNKINTSTRDGGGGISPEQREAELDAKSDYLSAPGETVTMRDYWGMDKEKRDALDKSAAERNPIRSTLAELGKPIFARVLSGLQSIFPKPVNLNEDLPVPVDALGNPRYNPVTGYPMTPSEVVRADLEKQIAETNAKAYEGYSPPQDPQQRQAAQQEAEKQIAETNAKAYEGYSPPQDPAQRQGQGREADNPLGDKGEQGEGYNGIAHGGMISERMARGGLPAPHAFYRQGKFGYKGPQVYADGGGIADLEGRYNLGGYSDGGRLLKGPGDGVSDDIPATIGHGQPARLADGEFVIPARIVSEIGNGSTDAGARELYKMMDRIQAGRAKTVGKDQVAKNSKAVRHLPA